MTVVEQKGEIDAFISTPEGAGGGMWMGAESGAGSGDLSVRSGGG